MTIRTPMLSLLLLVSASLVVRAEPPFIEHQPGPCTVPGKAISLCATITDDGQVAMTRVYFRPAGEKYFSYVEMAFGGLNFCATLPAPREGKAKSIEYYVQAIDDSYDSQRTSTFVMQVQGDAVCGFPPLETDPERARSITVHATHKKQGKKLPDEFESDFVTFVYLR